MARSSLGVPGVPGLDVDTATPAGAMALGNFPNVPVKVGPPEHAVKTAGTQCYQAETVSGGTSGGYERAQTMPTRASGVHDAA
ncbi:hypothetical protein Airi02_048080 [Actinoallomurus iriomotensis]|uniref:Uncharacterized protein n=1 Tax=Actinoallomurus iriomotensis TaxID=478107 RepID=A0A9W6S4E6_9ACTN|nr:hypothetical protein Airi02_048080 [Actinoallomurus iriomotensis]